MSTRAMGLAFIAVVAVLAPCAAQDTELAKQADARKLYDQAVATADLATRAGLLSQCLELDPKNVDARFALADCLWQQGNLAGSLVALAAARQAAAGTPGGPWDARAAEAYAQSKQATGEARLQLLRTATALDPKLGDAWIDLAEAEWAQNLRTDAARSLQRARSLKVTITPAWEERATEEFHRAYNAPLLVDTIRHYEVCVALSPGRQKAWFNLGNAYQDNGQLEKSADAYKKALEIDATYKRALWNLAIAQCSLDQPEAALETVARYAKLAETPNEQGSAEDFSRSISWRINQRRPGVVYLMDGDLWSARSGDPALMQIRLTEFGDISRAALSPNRTIAACVRHHTDLVTWDLVLKRLREHRLPRAGRVLDLAWSPDSERIALVQAVGESEAGDVFVLDPRTSPAEETLALTEHGQAQGLAWSPDGKQLAYARGGDQPGLAIVTLDGKVEALLEKGSPGVTVSTPRWSPTGTHIAYLQVRKDRSSSLWVVGTSGTDRPVQGSEVRGQQFQWTSTGRFVLYEQPAGPGLVGLYYADVQAGGSGEAGVDRSGLCFAASPGAKDEVAVAPQPEANAANLTNSVLLRVALPGRMPHAIIKLDETSYVADLGWDQRGELIGFIVGHLDPERRGQFEIVTVKPAPRTPDPQFLGRGVKPTAGLPKLLGLVPPAMGEEQRSGPTQGSETSSRGGNETAPAGQ